MTPDRPPLLELRDITKTFGGLTALDGVSARVPHGAIVGIIGPNGAGKTTIFNIVTGAFPTTSGEVLLEGRAISGLRPHRIVQAGIARTFQNIRLFSSMTVWEHLLVAQPHRGAGLARLLPTNLADPAAKRSAEQALETFGLQEVRHRLANSLPYGTQRKVEIARAVTAGPKLLLLDEPVAGMNHAEATDLRHLLHTLRDDGLSILLIEHDMPFVMSLCDYLYVLDFGIRIAEGEPAAVRRDRKVLDAYLGADA
jgi:branched-chain amino acid transport system ATP-binding protein